MEHPFPFDPTYGHDLEKLLTVPSPEGPADFDSFWKATYSETRDVPLKITRRKATSSNPRFEVWEIEFDSLDGFRVGGWVCAPVDGKIDHGIVVGHGYGGREDAAYVDGAVSIAPCGRGFHRSAKAGYPKDAPHHVIYGIKAKETYSHRGCVADLWNAASALLELHPEVAGRLHYSGESFGGGLGALAVPWEERWRKAHLVVPSFGNIPLRLTMPCVGSGESVRGYHRRHPECVEVLQYFDAATAARRIKCPVYFVCALFDPAVPPPGQFAVHNAAPSNKVLQVAKAGHFPYPEEAVTRAEMEKRLLEWWRS